MAVFKLIQMAAPSCNYAKRETNARQDEHYHV